MQESQYWDLAAKHLSGKTTPSEEKLLEEWIERSEENKNSFNAQKSLWVNTSASDVNFKRDSRWEELKSQIESEEEFSLFSIANIFKIAASIALFVAIGIILNLSLSNTSLVTINAPADSAILIVLPDKSIVWLNKSSELKYPENFETQKRQVALKGEAFFEITKDPEKPFVIAASGTITQVIGTSFNLMAREGENKVQVSVVSGKVAFYKEGATGNRLTLLPGENGEFNKRNNNLLKAPEANTNFLSWKTGLLKFENAALEDVFTALEKQYDYKIIVKNSRIYNCKITSTFLNQPIEKVLNELEILVGISYTIAGEQIIINGTSCN